MVDLPGDQQAILQISEHVLLGELSPFSTEVYTKEREVGEEVNIGGESARDNTNLRGELSPELQNHLTLLQLLPFPYPNIFIFLIRYFGGIGITEYTLSLSY